MTDQHAPDSDSLAVDRLIRAAGSRPVPGDDRTARVRAAVEREWRVGTRARRTRRWTAGGIVMLAAGTAAFLAVSRRSTGLLPASPPPPASIGRVAAAHGAVT